MFESLCSGKASNKVFLSRMIIFKLRWNKELLIVISVYVGFKIARSVSYNFKFLVFRGRLNFRWSLKATFLAFLNYKRPFLMERWGFLWNLLVSTVLVLANNFLLFWIDVWGSSNLKRFGLLKLVVIILRELSFKNKVWNLRFGSMLNRLFLWLYSTEV